VLRSSVHRQALHHEAGAKDEEERFAHADTLCSHQQHARVLPFVLPLYRSVQAKTHPQSQSDFEQSTSGQYICYAFLLCHVLPEGRWCTSPAVRLLHDYIATSRATTRYTVAEVHCSGVLKFIGSM